MPRRSSPPTRASPRRSAREPPAKPPATSPAKSGGAQHGAASASPGAPPPAPSARAPPCWGEYVPHGHTSAKNVCNAVLCLVALAPSLLVTRALYYGHDCLPRFPDTDDLLRSLATPRAAIPTSAHTPHCTLVAASP